MVKVVFLNLLRSKYGIESVSVNPGTVQSALDQVRALHPQIVAQDLEAAVLFINREAVTHLNKLREELHDGDEAVLTHFVGGG